MTHLYLNLIGISLLVCGLSCGILPAGPPETGPPTLIDPLTEVYATPPFILSDTKVLLSAYVGPYGAAGAARIDYGSTSGYGQTTPSQAFGPSSIFEITIGGLNPGSTYHWRFTLTTSGGVKMTPDSIFTLPATVTPFDFPLHIGDSWRYHYVGKSNTMVGVHTWRIDSTDGKGNWRCFETWGAGGGRLTPHRS
jgi:hypothetical protein